MRPIYDQNVRVRAPVCRLTCTCAVLVVLQKDFEAVASKNECVMLLGPRDWAVGTHKSPLHASICEGLEEKQTRRKGA
jgi:hypothetical protein